MDNKKS